MNPRDLEIELYLHYLTYVKQRPFSHVGTSDFVAHMKRLIPEEVVGHGFRWETYWQGILENKAEKDDLILYMIDKGYTAAVIVSVCRVSHSTVVKMRRNEVYIEDEPNEEIIYYTKRLIPIWNDLKLKDVFLIDVPKNIIIEGTE